MKMLSWVCAFAFFVILVVYLRVIDCYVMCMAIWLLYKINCRRRVRWLYGSCVLMVS